MNSLKIKEDRAYASEDYRILPLETMLKQKKRLPVKIGEIYSPEFFWLIPTIDNSVNEYKEILNEFYHENIQHLSPVKPIDLVTSLPCVVCCANQEYYRGTITNILNSSPILKCEVFFVDYGNIAVVDSRAICYLDRRFFDLPAQAFMAGLSGFKDDDGSEEPGMYIDQLKNLTEGRPLAAEYVTTMDEIAKVILHDLSDNRTINEKMMPHEYIEDTVPVNVDPVLPPEEQDKSDELAVLMFLTDYKEQAALAIQTCIEGYVEKRDFLLQQLHAKETKNEGIAQFIVSLQSKIESLHEVKTHFVQEGATNIF